MIGNHKSLFCSLILAIAILAFVNIAQAEDLTAEQFYERGFTENEKGQHAQAIADFTAAIQKNPQYWKAYANRAAAKYHSHDYRGAQKDMNIAFLHLPPLTTVSDLKVAIDQAVANEANLDSRRIATRQILRNAQFGGDMSGGAYGITQLANTVMRGGGKIPSDLVKPFPTDLIHPMTGHLLGNQPVDTVNAPAPETQSDTNAKSSGKTKIAAAGGDQLTAQGYFKQASEKSQKLDLEGAVKDYDECLKLDPKNGLALANRGALKFNLGNSNGALDDLNEACDLMPDNQQVKFLRDKVKQAIEQAKSAY